MITMSDHEPNPYQAPKEYGQADHTGASDPIVFWTAFGGLAGWCSCIILSPIPMWVMIVPAILVGTVPGALLGLFIGKKVKRMRQ